MSEFVICSVDDARRMLHWLAKRRRTSLSGLVKAAGMRSAAMVNFANLDEAKQRTRDTMVGLLTQVVDGNDHRLLARPAGGKHLQMNHPGAVPLEIRGAGGGLLEVPLRDLEDVRVVCRTMAAVNNCSVSAIAYKAGVSLTITSLVNGSVDYGDVSLRVFVEMLLAGGFELVVQPCYANRREARHAEKKTPGT